MNRNVGPTVFVVASDPAVGDSLEWLLESADMRVAVFRDVDEFLAALEPGRSGCLVLSVDRCPVEDPSPQKVFAAAGMTLPVIMLSAAGDASPVGKTTQEEGIFAFLRQPSDDQSLLDRIQEAMHLNARQRGGVEDEQ